MRDVMVLQANVDRLTIELTEAKERLTRAKIDASGIAIGDVVEKNGKHYRVCEIDVEWTTPWVKGNLRLKDGSWGVGVHNVFGDWRKVEDCK